MSFQDAFKNLGLTTVDTVTAATNVGKSTLNTTGKTIDATGNIVEATGDLTVNVAQNTGKLTTATTELTVQSLNTAGKFAEALGDNAKDLTDKSSEFTVSSLKSLTDQLNNANNITTTLMDTTNESLQKSSGHISNTVGNTLGDVSKITGILTNAASQSIDFGYTLFDSILSIIQSPFKSIQNEIDEIKKRNDDPKNKFNKIKNLIIKNYDNDIKKGLTKNFINQLESMINNVDKLINLYEKLGCKKGWLKYNCSEDINNNIYAINRIKDDMKIEKDEFKEIIESIFNTFYSHTARITNLGVNSNNFDAKIDEMESNIENIQNEIITDATNKLTEIIKVFDSKLDAIKTPINELSASFTTQLKGTTEINGGKKIKKSRKQKSKKTKSKKTKSKRK